ncbi:polysaccharide pyruvyl transferase family protein [Thiohalocapsa marina]|uniref:polysaccharide pyruvyl transferase family protein n=1 Tax=Thiohalocapsa marina TaxID=424902 RepID=UPI0014784D50|nr:polysaccharide pyruvyl transferase family protein [Thiohalocapsa marina]
MGESASCAVETYLELPRDGDLLLIHKGQTEHWSLQSLQQLGQFSCLWANSVFALYAHRSRRRWSDWPIARHVPRRGSLERLPVKRPGTPEVLLISAGNMGNLGDDAVTTCAARIIGAAAGAAHIVRRGPPIMRADVARASCVVLGGGGLLYDACPHNLQNYALPLLMAAELHRPAVCLGIGTQGVRTDLGRRLLAHALSNCRWVSVRDPGDADRLRDIAPDAKLSVDQDLAFHLGTVAVRTGSINPEYPRIGVSWVSPEPMLAKDNMRKYQRAIDETADLAPPGASIELVVQSRDDLSMYQRWQNHKGLRIRTFKGQAIEAVLEYYACLDLVLTSRYHGFIFALLTGRPVICTGSSQGKIARLIKYAVPSAEPCFIALAEFDSSVLHERLIRYMNDPHALMPKASEVIACVERARALDQRLAYECGKISGQ